MNTYHSWMLVRELIVLAFFAVLVIGGLLLARLVGRRPPASSREAPAQPMQRIASPAPVPHYRDGDGLAEANDADAVPAPAVRRAA